MMTWPSFRFHWTSTPFGFRCGDLLGEPVQTLGAHEDLALGVQAEKIFDRLMAEHGDESRIYIQEFTAEGAAANAEGGTQNQRASAGFGTAEGFFIALVLDGGGQLLGNKLQNLAITIPEADVFMVALDD